MLLHVYFLSPSWITVIGTVVERSTLHQETFQCVLSLVTRHGGCRFLLFKKIIMTIYLNHRVSSVIKRADNTKSLGRLPTKSLKNFVFVLAYLYL